MFLCVLYMCAYLVLLYPCSKLYYMVARCTNAGTCLYVCAFPQWWMGVFTIYLRLCQTSFLLFFDRRVLKTFFATLAALAGVAVQLQYRPFLVDSDGRAAIIGSWIVFAWLFALQAYDALSTMPDWAWGVPLVLFTFAGVADSVVMVVVEIRKYAAPANDAGILRYVDKLRNQMASMNGSDMLVKPSKFLNNIDDDDYADMVDQGLETLRESVVKMQEEFKEARSGKVDRLMSLGTKLAPGSIFRRMRAVV
jgi:hypothetical protein